MVAFWHGQKRYQFDQDDAELSDLGGWGIHAAIVRTVGALCVEGLLARIVPTHRIAPGGQPRACPELVEGAAVPTSAFAAESFFLGKKCGPIAGATF
jgi:hypothetical protein